MTEGRMTKHILVADDDPHILEIISFALGKTGMRVTLARAGVRLWKPSLPRCRT